MPLPPPQHVLIIGGGLAGIAAATACRSAGLRVTLLEARRQLGGRATSYVDRQSGETIDNCQHVSMGCCTQLRHLCGRLGIDQAFETIERLHFVALDGRVTDFSASGLPAPMHLAGAFFRLPYLSLREKWLFAQGIRHLVRTPVERLRGRNLRDWLAEHRQTDNLIRHVWEVVLISALSESIDRIDASYARKVFVDGFLTHCDGWRVEIPNISLEELYSRRTLASLERMGIVVRLNCAAEQLTFETGMFRSVHLKDGIELTADDAVCAVPHHMAQRLLGGVPELSEVVSGIEQIDSAPITSVHLWFDRPICPLPHAVLVGRLGHWLFDRGERTVGDRMTRYYQVVMSASRNLDGWSEADIADRVVDELGEIWPQSRTAERIHFRVVTERRAVFSAVPGIDRLRPHQQTAILNLQLAGDWTQTGWPATMEGAVRSGYLAAENILSRHGISLPPAVGDLPVGLGARLLLGIPKRSANRPT